MRRTKGLHSQDDEGPRPTRPPTRTVTPMGVAPAAGSSSAHNNDDNSTVATADIPPPPALKSQEQAPPISGGGGSRHNQQQDRRRVVLPDRDPNTSSRRGRQQQRRCAPMPPESAASAAPAKNNGMSEDQFQVKAYMAALDTQAETAPIPRMTPGAVPVQGSHSQELLNPSQQEEWDNVAADERVEDDGGDHYYSHHDNDHPHHLVAAHLVESHEDEADMAARVAERLERQLTEQFQERLKQEIEAQLKSTQFQQQQQQHQQPHAIAEAVVTVSSSGSGNSVNGNGHDNFKVCGLRRRTWGVLLTLLLVLAAGAVIGVIFYLRSQEETKGPAPTPTPAPVTERTSNPVGASPTRTPTLRPTSGPTTPMPTINMALESLLQELSPWIAPTAAEMQLLRNESTPQYQALEFLANDPWVLSTTHSTRILVERYALLVLYYSTGGPSWSLPPWNLEGDACRWNSDPDWESGINNDALGVFCYSEGDDAEESSTQFLYLKKVNLTGSIPWELSLLSNLIQLELDENSLRGTIPAELSQLSRLGAFWVRSNLLTGSIPTCFAPTIESLDFGDNALTGTLPSQWGDGSCADPLSNLYWFAADLNALSGPLPDSWQALEALEFLDLGSNRLSGTISAIYGNVWSQAQGIWMESNDFTGTLPSELGQLTGLRNFWIYDNLFTGTVPTELANLTLLEAFSFSGNGLTGDVDGIFCVDLNFTSSMTILEGDCLPNESGQAEITCSCCTSCCDSEGSYCEDFST